jgi:hypothetical protein
MKAIKTPIILILGMIILISCNPTDDGVRVFSGDDFIRFSLVLDANNNPIEYPFLTPPAFVEEVEYEKSTLRTLKIPVTLTTTRNIGNVTVNFETINSGNISSSDFTMIPSDGVLNFSNAKLTDTIFLNQNSRITDLNSGQIQFNLNSTSDSNIKLGYNREINALKSLNIILSPTVTTTFTFEKSREEILGSEGETVIVGVKFPEGYIASDVEGVNLFSETLSDFNYSLAQQPLTNATQVDYILTLNENIQIDELELKTRFALNDLSGYTANGNTNFTILKPIITDRDNSVFTSNNFYDLGDAFHRTYGEHWFDSNEDAVCSWQTYSTFTYPVVVSADHPNAVLFDNMGTADPSDDSYHHAFRVGFNSPNDVATTNSFDLKRWFDNEASNQSNSPGFNISEALEFFPTEGTSATDGFVQVIEQDILVSSTTGTQHIIAISGNGTYSETSPGIFQIQLEFSATNTELFGGTRTDIYRIYNTNSYSDPADLTEICKVPIAL